MKTRLLLFILLAFASGTFAQNSIETVLRKYKNDEGVVSLNFKGDLSKFLTTKDGSKLRSKIDACEVLVFKDNEDVNNTDKTKIKTALSTDKYEMLINVKDKRGKMELHAISKGDVLSKVYGNVKYENKTILLIFTGSLLFEELNKMNFDFEGGEAFKSFLD